MDQLNNYRSVTPLKKKVKKITLSAALVLCVLAVFIGVLCGRAISSNKKAEEAENLIRQEKDVEITRLEKEVETLNVKIRELEGELVEANKTIAENSGTEADADSEVSDDETAKADNDSAKKEKKSGGFMKGLLITIFVIIVIVCLLIATSLFLKRGESDEEDDEDDEDDYDDYDYDDDEDDYEDDDFDDEE